MKKILCLLISLGLLLSMCGCERRENSNACTFYYPRSDFGHNVQEGKFHESAIEGEIREDVSSKSVSETLQIYLSGPSAPHLSNPYPAKTSLVSASIADETLYITVTDHLSELTGIHLMIACACLGKTGMELTNATSVQISCKKALLDGKKSITLHGERIVIADSTPDTTYEQE